ncbi:MAG: nucleotide exchange factor GrpE [Deltaproteobacteria bacterium CG11_big_fil_rev_8_21_14_0_20_45_16]|nr:MAG: nucleotide exchange factor GrpE [Deltaproteobacteria bacterium CG11_big_fil_rev_8_21_14_0_20_45_16]
MKSPREDDENQDLKNKEERPSHDSEGAAKNDTDSVRDLKAERERLQFDLASKENEIGRLKSKVQEYETKVADIREYIKKMETEISEIRDRARRDQDQLVQSRLANFFRPFLDILDNFERSLNASPSREDSFYEGIKLIQKQLLDVLQSVGLKRIDPINESFDPVRHEALAVQRAEQDDVILEVVKAGYEYKGQLIRPSQVVVGKKSV